MGYIIHYKDGKTITEEEMDWERIPKDGITSIQLKDTKNNLVHTLSGFNGKALGWFQHKVGFVRMDTMEQITDVEQEIGVIINKEGDCIILNMNKRFGQVKVYQENVFKLGLNLELHGIKPFNTMNGDMDDMVER